MSSLLGPIVLGHAVEHDTRPDWIKINGVVLGDSHAFGYKAMDGDIGPVLDALLPDTNVVVVLYNWSARKAYVKIGFNLTNPADSMVNPDYTSFVVIKRIRPSYVGPTPPQPPQPTPCGPSGFVTWNGDTFTLNNKPWVPVGFNAYWLGFTENRDYPTNDQITEMFQIAVTMKATVIRSHTLGFSSGDIKSLRPRDTTLNSDAWRPIDFAFAEATKYGIKLVCPMTDSYNYYHGNYGDFCYSRGVDKTRFWTDTNVRQDFKKYIHDWLTHKNSITGVMIKDSPALLFVELGNELGNIRPGATSTTVPTLDWLRDISSYVKTVAGRKCVVLDGSDECLGDNDFTVDSMDCYSAHFYGEDWGRLNKGSSGSVARRKPYIIGEYASTFPDEWFNAIEGMKSVKGTIFWGVYPNKSGKMGTSPIIHDDGFTLNWINSDMPTLVRLSNHFRRMQRLPTIDSF
jgi:mannan endo-1,4-beta-mannosidase